MKADKIFYGGRIYIMDAGYSSCEAIAVKAGKIADFGSSAELKLIADEKTEMINLEGKTMFPGFIDSHLHAPGNAYNALYNIDMYSARSAEETMEIIRDFVDKNPKQSAYYGRGFTPAHFTGLESIKGPRKERLDEICKDKPILLTDFGGHVLWCNSAALDKYNITDDTVSPDGGIIEKDPDTGAVWGTLKEYARQLIPYQAFTAEENVNAAKWLQDRMHEYGYTAIFSFGPPGAIIPRETIFEAFYDMEQQGELKLRVCGARDMDPAEEPEAQIEELRTLKEKFETKLIKVTAAKYFADGVIDAVTACLLEPYASDAGQDENFCGEFIWEKERMRKAFKLTIDAGFQIHVHAIGDGAVRYTLDALEGALSTADGSDLRSMLTHLQLVSPEDIKRMSDMNVIASVQPFWHFKDPALWFSIEKPFLGTLRAENQYPLKSFLDNKVKIASSSDYPVTPDPNPFIAIQTGVTRDIAGSMQENEGCYALNKAEGVTVADLIKSYTVDGAYALGREDEIGSLEKGKCADFIILDKDPHEVALTDLSRIKVLETYFNGERVFCAEL